MTQDNQNQAITEITELIKNARDTQQLRRITITQLQIVAVTYEAIIRPQHVIDIYRDYLVHCLQDKMISEDEAENLAHLKLILGINDRLIDEVHEEVVHQIYQESVAEAVGDGRLEPEERKFLEKLQYDLSLSPEIAAQLYDHKAKEYLDRYYQFTIQDERLSPKEDEELHAIARSLGVDLKMDEHTQSILNKYRLYWVIENGELPEESIDLELENDEKCYLCTSVTWYEQRHKNLSQRIGSIRFYRSAYQQIDDLDVAPLTDAEWEEIDTGTAYITNKNLILGGENVNFIIPLEQILDVKTYRNGLEIISSVGTSPFLKFETGVDIFLVLLGRAIRDLES